MTARVELLIYQRGCSIGSLRRLFSQFFFFKRALPGVLMETDNTQVATDMLLLSDFNQLKHTKLCTQSHNVQIVIHMSPYMSDD